MPRFFGGRTDHEAHDEQGCGGPGGAGGEVAVVPAQRQPLRELLDDSLLERSRDDAGGLRLTSEGSMLGEMVRVVLERALEAELTAHLGYEKHDRDGQGGNSRNGTSGKTVQTGVGPVPLRVPRDRAGTFEPLLVPKGSGRVSAGWTTWSSASTRGMSVRDIVHHLRQVYGTDLSPDGLPDHRLGPRRPSV